MARSSKAPDLGALGDGIVNELLGRTGVEERRSRFADRPALFHDGREFFHLDEPGLADIRLGRHRIRSRIEQLRSHPLVELRPNTSDWLQVRFASSDDAAFVLGLALDALEKD